MCNPLNFTQQDRTNFEGAQKLVLQGPIVKLDEDHKSNFAFMNACIQAYCDTECYLEKYSSIKVIDFNNQEHQKYLKIALLVNQPQKLVDENDRLIALKIRNIQVIGREEIDQQLKFLEPVKKTVLLVTDVALEATPGLGCSKPIVQAGLSAVLDLPKAKLISADELQSYFPSGIKPQHYDLIWELRLDTEAKLLFHETILKDLLSEKANRPISLNDIQHHFVKGVPFQIAPRLLQHNLTPEASESVYNRIVTHNPLSEITKERLETLFPNGIPEHLAYTILITPNLSDDAREYVLEKVSADLEFQKKSVEERKKPNSEEIANFINHIVSNCSNAIYHYNENTSSVEHKQQLTKKISAELVHINDFFETQLKVTQFQGNTLNQITKHLQSVFKATTATKKFEAMETFSSNLCHEMSELNKKIKDYTKNQNKLENRQLYFTEINQKIKHFYDGLIKQQNNSSALFAKAHLYSDLVAETAFAATWLFPVLTPVTTPFMAAALGASHLSKLALQDSESKSSTLLNQYQSTYEKCDHANRTLGHYSEQNFEILSSLKRERTQTIEFLLSNQEYVIPSVFIKKLAKEVDWLEKQIGEGRKKRDKLKEKRDEINDKIRKLNEQIKVLEKNKLLNKKTLAENLAELEKLIAEQAELNVYINNSNNSIEVLKGLRGKSTDQLKLAEMVKPVTDLTEQKMNKGKTELSEEQKKLIATFTQGLEATREKLKRLITRVAKFIAP